MVILRVWNFAHTNTWHLILYHLSCGLLPHFPGCMLNLQRIRHGLTTYLSRYLVVASWHDATPRQHLHSATVPQCHPAFIFSSILHSCFNVVNCCSVNWSSETTNLRTYHQYTPPSALIKRSRPLLLTVSSSRGRGTLKAALWVAAISPVSRHNTA